MKPTLIPVLLLLFSTHSLTQSVSSSSDPPSKTTPETLGMVLTQSFFDNMQNNLVEPLFASLEGMQIGNFSPLELDLELLLLDYNITNMAVNTSRIDPSNRIVTLQEGSTKLSIPNLYLVLEYEYGLLTDPPLFADLGATDINI